MNMNEGANIDGGGEMNIDAGFSSLPLMMWRAEWNQSIAA